MPDIAKTLTQKNTHKIIRKFYKQYGLYTVEDRAVPDFRDGLKPVARRILWAMYQLDLHHTSPFKKSARIVGDTMGKYHPHGDCLAGDTKVYLLCGKSVTIESLVGKGPKWVL
jgi:DNA gyrase/topoisomerase IV subunit A